MCQGFSHFSGFLHHFVLAKLATSSIRVKKSASIPASPSVGILLELALLRQDSAEPWESISLAESLCKPKVLLQPLSSLTNTLCYPWECYVLPIKPMAEMGQGFNLLGQTSGQCQTLGEQRLLTSAQVYWHAWLVYGSGETVPRLHG